MAAGAVTGDPSTDAKSHAEDGPLQACQGQAAHGSCSSPT